MRTTRSRIQTGSLVLLTSLLLLTGASSCLRAQEKPVPGTNAGKAANQAGTQQEPGRNAAEEKSDDSPPAVNPGRPTITDPASLTAPGWLESEVGGMKNFDHDRSFSTPFLLKLTSKNNRLQYRLATDGLIFPGAGGGNGFGDTYAGLNYLFARQKDTGFDISGRVTVKIPTAPAFLGTRKVDFNALFLASRDFTPSLHADFNAGLSTLTRQGAPGTDNQFLATASFTIPIKGGRWQYTNEVVYSSPIQGQRALLTTMHGFTYAVHRYDVYDIALQWKLHGDGSNLQLLFGKTFFFGRLF
jgi:hypothetical protein